MLGGCSSASASASSRFLVRSIMGRALCTLHFPIFLRIRSVPLVSTEPNFGKLVDPCLMDSGQWILHVYMCFKVSEGHTFVFDMCIYISTYEHIPLNSQYNILDVRLIFISKNTYICIYIFYICYLLLLIRNWRSN